MTGFPAKVRQIVGQRAGIWCEKCGIRQGTQIHHRRPRGMGGSQQENTNVASNALLLCSECHLLIEDKRQYGNDMGWLVRQHHNPSDIPVRYRGSWVFLDDLGNLLPILEVI